MAANNACVVLPMPTARLCKIIHMTTSIREQSMMKAAVKMFKKVLLTSTASALGCFPTGTGVLASGSTKQWKPSLFLKSGLLKANMAQGIPSPMAMSRQIPFFIRNIQYLSQIFYFAFMISVSSFCFSGCSDGSASLFSLFSLSSGFSSSFSDTLVALYICSVFTNTSFSGSPS